MMLHHNGGTDGNDQEAMVNLALELNKDRRTIAKALADIAPDGYLQGKPAWRLQTALQVLDVGKGSNEEHPLFSMMVDRLDGWEGIDYRDTSGDFSIEIAAKLMNESPEVLLRWLRAGCPYVREGSLNDGNGFIVRLSWLMEWSALVLHAARNVNVGLLRRLHLQS